MAQGGVDFYGIDAERAVAIDREITCRSDSASEAAIANGTPTPRQPKARGSM
jgi:hypothetical protein